ncbi:UPF0651 protein, mitochondrial [[Candida] railenensis]|uniref:UPF0651 protein, mitochondrial n=1 Tax=[Candida] railenensis TaxID=45579 RepID=A0A9P0VZI8_9ASCO|nr:UPF0651 protein, mitochondrial [[Candida] railenensis]
MLRRSVLHNKYAFYDLVLATPSRPTQPIESEELMEKIKKSQTKARKDGSTTFEGNYKLDKQTAEERIKRIFGGRIKGEPPRSSSRVIRGEPKVIAGVKVPARPNEPDNCCMSGCINCVWELFNDDLKDWNSKRKEAAVNLRKTGGRWPEDFDAPVKFLKSSNLPKSLLDDPEKISKSRQDKSGGWGDVPMSIRVFAETEKKLKLKRQEQQQQQQQQQTSQS